MTELSPAAQAVLTASAKSRCFREWDHVNDPPCHPNDAHWNGCYQCVDRGGVAAALRAASHQLTSAKAIDTLLAIANELENQ